MPNLLYMCMFINLHVMIPQKSEIRNKLFDLIHLNTIVKDKLLLRYSRKRLSGITLYKWQNG